MSGNSDPARASRIADCVTRDLLLLVGTGTHWNFLPLDVRLTRGGIAAMCQTNRWHPCFLPAAAAPD